MVDTQPTERRTHTWRRLLLSLLAVAVIVTLAVVTAPKPAAPVFRRYVGPPLPDGSRVTFLYPATAQKFFLGRRGYMGQVVGVQYVQSAHPHNIGERLLYLAPAWKQFRSGNDCSVSIIVYNLGSLTQHLEGLQSGRSEGPFRSATSQGSDRFYGDNIDVIDAKSRLEYVFQYTHSGILTNTALAKDESRITSSFQVLPPGAAVPAP